MNDVGASCFGFDDLFWPTLWVLFLSAMVGVLLRRFRRNGCLKLFDNYHVTYIGDQGRVLWAICMSPAKAWNSSTIHLLQRRAG